MPVAKPAPDLKIHHGHHTVKVSVIDTTAFVGNIPCHAFMEPVMPGMPTLNVPCYSVLIKHHHGSGKHQKYDTLLWDLGVRKDWQNSPKAIVDRITNGNFKLEVKKDVHEIMKDHGESPEKVGAIIWSHWHWDHTGDPSTFPLHTDLIVGPGFRKKFVEAGGFPTNPDSPIAESAWAGRTLREIDFESSSPAIHHAEKHETGKQLMLGRFRALDFYGDGSFFLLDSPGHAIGHMCALARTNSQPAEYIFLGGDIAHHGCEFRPTPYLPIPDQISPNPYLPAWTKHTSVCPGMGFEHVHPKHDLTVPFVNPASGEGAIHADSVEAKESIDKMTEFDGHENVFCLIAHDASLLDVIDFFPKKANDWKKKGWKREGLWRFLKDLEAVEGKSG